MKDATNDIQTVRMWETSYPAANWGLACGAASGVIVIDVDQKAGGFASFDAFCTEHGIDLRSTLTATTGGGGRHYFLRAPSEPVGNRVNWLPGVDVRADGGHVILPPGRHISGGTYRWDNPTAEPLNAPLAIVESIRGRSTSGGLDDAAGMLDGIPEGQRDETLFRWACRLRRQHASDTDGGRAVVTTLVLEAARKSGFPERDALAKVEQAFKQDHSDSEPSWRGDPHERLVLGGAFVLDEPEQIPAVWGHDEFVLWAEGEGLMLAGHQGLGKTTIAQQLVLSRVGVRDESFLGYPVSSSTGRVLYLAMDRPRQAARSFRRMVAEVDRASLDQRLVVWRGPLPLDPTKKGAFIEWVREVVPDVDTLVVDSVKDLAPGLVDDTVASSLNSAWQSVIADGIELLLLHHERKAASDSRRTPALDNIYGSTWLTSGLGSVLALAGDPGSDQVTLHHVKQPGDTVGPLDVHHDHRAGLTTLLDGARLTVEEAIALNGTATVSTVASMTGLSEKTVRRRLKEMTDAGYVTRDHGVHTASGRTEDQYTIVRDA